MVDAPVTDDLEALYNAPAVGEDATDEAQSALAKAQVTVLIRLDGEPYGFGMILPEGFPTRFADEREGVESYANYLAKLVHSIFVAHYTEGEEPE